MFSNSNKVNIIEHSHISPPPGTVAGKSFPLTFFDLPILHYSSMQSLFYYNRPNCNPSTLLPNLKHSLSITLKHFVPFAGNIILHPPFTTTRHEIRYVDGNSVPVTFATSNPDNFHYLTKTNPLHVTELLPFTAQLPPCTVVSGSIVAPILAIQVTFFPNTGICIGITRDHVVGDASAWIRFVRAWALITKTSSDETFLAGDSIPFLDRSVITDSKNIYNIYLSQIEHLHERFITKNTISPRQSNIFRGSFVVSQAKILDLKKLVSLKKSQMTNLAHVSSFVVVCAYVWSCLAKVRSACGEEIQQGEIENFTFAVGARARLDPPVPDNYLGNCFTRCLVSTESAILMGENGFLVGVEVIGEAIGELLNGEEGIMKNIDKWLIEREEKKGQRTIRVAGTPKFSLNDIDFGWGIPKRTDYVYMTMELVVSIDVCNDSRGGLEIGVSLPKNEMDAFTVIFEDGLNKGY